eukprot:TRINITY_DN9065_c0_g1_i2.p1 TRINITY_DN9065_c0_g1~~TRINITY_DN9065_c0_g1_i2.p1  ORF type:complete len:616 (-),score=136.72 TRINITY_DN9065_c0_g1_i2:189-1985(-)
MSDELCINSIRVFAADMVQRANSGHPGAPIGMAPMAHVLWTRFLRHSPSNPEWYNRDRFVLSNGHACALLYTLLHLSGYKDFPFEQIENFRQVDSNTPGHPENHFGGVEVTTGPLGQGIANAVGLAMAQEHLAATYNREEAPLFGNFTYVLCGDGCLMEGISAEAASLAGHLGLGRLIVLYDDNEISIDGSTSLAFTEDVPARFAAYGWHTVTVADGDNDLEGIEAAINEARAVTDKPTLISVKTTIGKGSVLEGTSKCHGSPLGDEDIRNLKTKFGLDPEKKLFLDDAVKKVYADAAARGDEAATQWNALFEKYAAADPEKGKELTRRFSGALPDGIIESLPRFTPQDGVKATRQHSETLLNALAPQLPDLIGGSADLAPSNLTIFKGSSDFQKGNYVGKILRFGVREHAMGAIVNGFAAYGGFLPFGATFLNFLGYMQGAVTLTALSGLKAFFIMTHDSIGLGEDGPTHQPVEKVMESRATPNLLTLRPADGNETSGAYAAMLLQKNRPSLLSLTRQKLPNLEGSSIEGTLRGAYVVQREADGKAADIVIAATGSEVSLAVDATKEATMADLNVRVVSMPCWELFEEQEAEYRFVF